MNWSGSAFLFLFPPHIFKIRHFTHARGESQTRALHRHCGSSSASIMHHRWWFLCELSLEFYIWPSNPLFPGWVMTATVSLPLSLCRLPSGFSAHRSLNPGLSDNDQSARRDGAGWTILCQFFVLQKQPNNNNNNKKTHKDFFFIPLQCFYWALQSVCSKLETFCSSRICLCLSTIFA